MDSPAHCGLQMSAPDPLQSEMLKRIEELELQNQQLSERLSDCLARIEDLEFTDRQHCE